MRSIRYVFAIAIIAAFTAAAVPTPAAAMQQSQEMAAQAKHHKAAKHRSVVHRTTYLKMKQGACRHKATAEISRSLSPG